MDRRRGRRAIEVALGMGIAAFLLGATAPVASAQQDPGGANGTIKIDGVAFDEHPDDEPKPGCSFQVDFYGFDADDPSAEVVFTAQGGTGDGVIESGTVTLDGDPNDGGGSEAGFDGGANFDLTDELTAADSPFTAAPDGRYHVKVDVTVFNSDGTEEAHKSKVFKLEGCGSVEPLVVPPTPTETPAQVLAVETAAPAAPAQVEATNLARTGDANGRIALTGLGAVLAGAGFLLYSWPDRQRQPRHAAR